LFLPVLSSSDETSPPHPLRPSTRSPGSPHSPYSPRTSDCPCTAPRRLGPRSRTPVPSIFDLAGSPRKTCIVVETHHVPRGRPNSPIVHFCRPRWCMIVAIGHGTTGGCPRLLRPAVRPPPHYTLWRGFSRTVAWSRGLYRRHDWQLLDSASPAR